MSDEFVDDLSFAANPNKAPVSEEQPQNRNLEEQLGQLIGHDWNRNAKLKRTIEAESLPRAAELMEQFCEGGHDVLLALQKRGKLPKNMDIPIPEITDKHNDDPEPRLITNSVAMKEDGYVPGSASVDVDVEMLEVMVEYDEDATISVNSKGPDGPIEDLEINGATADLIMYTAGVEEYVESARLQSKAESRLSTIKLDEAPEEELGLAGYDALTPEYASLGWRIRLLIDKQNQDPNVDQEMVGRQIKVMKERLTRAAELRKQFRQEVE